MDGIFGDHFDINHDGDLNASEHMMDFSLFDYFASDDEDESEGGKKRKSDSLFDDDYYLEEENDFDSSDDESFHSDDEEDELEDRLREEMLDLLETPSDDSDNYYVW